jgi:phospholipid/cholesterol/gamma-HCH transport system substrate-binding protein
MKNTLETRLGIFAALTLMAVIVIIEVAGGFDFFKKGHRIHARFESIQELKEGDPVKMAGVEIGRVEKVNPPADNKVDVELKLDSKRAELVKTDSKATIKFTGLMGQNYVSISFGSVGAPPLKEGRTLDTTEQPDLSQLMEKLGNVATGVESLTTNFNFGNITELLGPMTDFVKQNTPRITAILGNAQTISDQIAKGEGTVGRLIKEDTLYTSALGAVTNLNLQSQEISRDIRGVVDQARTTITQINEGQGTLGRLIKDESLYRETAASMVQLKEILEKINRGQGSAGKFVNDESLYRNARMTLQKVEKATEGLEDQGPLSVLGTMINSLF